MRALVTGGAGFVGSHIVDALIEAGHDVCVIDNLWNQGGGNIKNIHLDATFYQMDIRSPSLIDIFKKYRPEIIYHQAAQHSVKISTDDPVLDAKVNILGLINIMQCCIEVNTSRIILASTGATHGVIDKLPVSEETPQRPICPYGITKMAEEHYLRYWNERCGLNYTIFRYANIYGPRQDATGEAGVIAIFARKIIDNETVTIKWDGEQTRDFVYVGDIVRANMLIARGDHSAIYCLGTGTDTSINDIFYRLAKITGNRPLTKRAPKTPGDQRHSVFDSSKFRKQYGWVPKTSLDEGLRRTVDFFRKAKM